MASISLGERRMAKTKYGIKIPLAVDDYIWVTKDTGRCNMWNLEPELYDSEAEAKTAAEIWGPVAKVAEYDKNNIVS